MAVEPDVARVLPNGKILITSSFAGDGDSYGLLIQLNANGTLDLGFDVKGYTDVRHPKYPTWIGPMLITSDGEIVVAGTVQIEGKGFRGLFARYHSNGSRDASFGEKGFAIVDQEGTLQNEISAITQGADNKLIGIGSTSAETQNGMVVGRNADGSPREDFNGGKITELHLDVLGHTWSTGKLLSTNRLLVAGYTFGEASADVVLARYTLTGELDSAFGAGKGWVRTTIGTSIDMAHSLLPQDATFIVSGTYFNNSGPRGVLLRYWN